MAFDGQIPKTLGEAINPQATKVNALELLHTAAKEMADRAVQRDKVEVGERSMASTVKTFNSLTGHSLTEAEGWEFMVCLKLVRGRQGTFREDDYVDTVAYSALLGECMGNQK